MPLLHTSSLHSLPVQPPLPAYLLLPPTSAPFPISTISVVRDVRLVHDGAFPPFLDPRHRAHPEGYLDFWNSVSCETELLVGGFENSNFGMKLERKSAPDVEAWLSCSSGGAS